MRYTYQREMNFSFFSASAEASRHVRRVEQRLA